LSEYDQIARIIYQIGKIGNYDFDALTLFDCINIIYIDNCTQYTQAIYQMLEQQNKDANYINRIFNNFVELQKELIRLKIKAKAKK